MPGVWDPGCACGPEPLRPGLTGNTVGVTGLPAGGPGRQWGPPLAPASLRRGGSWGRGVPGAQRGGRPASPSMSQTHHRHASWRAGRPLPQAWLTATRAGGPPAVRGLGWTSLHPCSKGRSHLASSGHLSSRGRVSELAGRWLVGGGGGTAAGGQQDGRGARTSWADSRVPAEGGGCRCRA